jgi:AP-4 complex subunit sigma-1
MIKFVLMVNKQGQTRLAKYTDASLGAAERRVLEAEIVRKCLARPDKQCNFIDHRALRVVYRRYASLFFLVGVDAEENELAVLEFIHCMVETLDKWFSNVCELDIMFGLDTVSPGARCPGESRAKDLSFVLFFTKGLAVGRQRQQEATAPSLRLAPTLAPALVDQLQAHFILDEMLANGYVVETNKHNVLAPIQLLERAT